MFMCKVAQCIKTKTFKDTTLQDNESNMLFNCFYRLVTLNSIIAK